MQFSEQTGKTFVAPYRHIGAEAPEEGPAVKVLGTGAT